MQIGYDDAKVSGIKPAHTDKENGRNPADFDSAAALIPKGPNGRMNVESI